jgi:single-stranded DNA-binding protein
LVRDAEKKILPTGSTVVSFDIANNIGWGDNKKVVYVTVNMWGKSGDGVFPYLKKSNPVAVTGELEVQKWIGKADGVEHSRLALSCNRLTLLGSATHDMRNDSYTKNPPPIIAEEVPEDFPF